MTLKMTKKTLFIFVFISVITFTAHPLKAAEVTVQESADQTVTATPNAGQTANTDREKEKSHDHGNMKDEDMAKAKEHEGMHGMMGHDMKGWWIVIGVVMVIMMGAHVAVLF